MKNNEFQNTGRIIHIKDEEGNVRIRVDIPDKRTGFAHKHYYDKNGNSLDINGNIVPKDSPKAHIPLQ